MSATDHRRVSAGRAVARPADPTATHRAAPGGLRYVNDGDPGLSRRRHGRGFAYRDGTGRRVDDEPTLRRIRALAIPPAWTDVWICPWPTGHIQAVGRDARRRKQYRYHPRWREVRDRSKFDRLIAFGDALPRLRRRVERDLARRGLDRPRVLAAVVRLLDTTLLRVGNEEYARENRSFGLTTLRDRHSRVSGATMRFSFRGKGGKRHEVSMRDARMARIVRRCQELPGQRLFQYVDDDGQAQPVDSDDVNEYIREAMGDEFSARDFRTWAATVLALRCLRRTEAVAQVAAREAAAAAKVNDAAASRRAVVSAVNEVARWLGNTPAVCRSAYIHPAVLGEYVNGGLPGGGRRPAAIADGGAPRPGRRGLNADEREVLALLRKLQRRRAAA